MKNYAAKLALFALVVEILSPSFDAFAKTKKIKRAPASGTSWTVSGYLPEQPGKKVYVKISGDTIESVSPSKPSGPVVDTDAVIFPGLMDMHSHVKYNILPLWDLAKSQFLNRFEWRSKFSDYKDAVSANMKGVKGDAVCAAVRWAEIKAMTGGATAIQGIGGDSKCAKGFGVNNIELPEDMGKYKIRAMTDMVMPDLVGKVFRVYIEPYMDEGLSYEEAYAKMLEEQKVTAWVNFFVNEPHTLGNGLKLLIGEDFGLKPTQNSTTDYGKVKPKIREYLAAEPYNVKEKQIEKQIAAMEIWIFGKGGKDAYLTAKKDEKKAYDFLSKGGVLTVNSSIRRYIGMFESSVRQSAINYYKQKDAKAIIAHVAEGMRDDRYNRLEYQYARKFGLARQGLVIIHGVGLDKKDFEDAAKNKISIVWSPFSNLLLYGETLDVEEAMEAGVNIALGVDWTPTGSKHILDELKIARRYLDKEGIRSVTNRDLAEMVTINAAKALRLDHIMGKVAPRYKANLTLIACEKGKSPYDCLVDGGQKDVELVVMNGQGLYGEVDHIKAIANLQKDREEPELLPSESSGCEFQKAIRYLPPTAYDKSIASKRLDLRSVAKIQDVLESALKQSTSRKQKATLDPLFNCEDEKYAQRFESYIEKELDQNMRVRESARRQTYKLDDDWTPFSLDEGEVESDDEEH